MVAGRFCPCWGHSLSWSKDAERSPFLPVLTRSLIFTLFSSVSCHPLCIQPWTELG